MRKRSGDLPEFSQEQYDERMRAQAAWKRYLSSANTGGSDPVTSFKSRDSGSFKAIVAVMEETSKAGDPIRLDGADFSNVLFDGIRFDTGTPRDRLEPPRLAGACFVGAFLRKASFRHARLSRAGFDGAHLEDARLEFADLRGASLSEAALPNAALTDADARGARFTGANLYGASLLRADLRDAYLLGARLTSANLDGTCLEGAILGAANLTNASFGGARLSGTTDLDDIVFDSGHRAMQDGSDAIVLSSLRDRWFNWGRIRRLGSLPLFGVSYVALSVALAVVTAIGYLNQARFIPALTYPIPLPGRTLWALLASSALAAGTTLYKLRCPQRVQTFTETEWVEQHGHPRLLYLAESLRRPWQLPTAVLLWVGAAAAGALLAERFWVALRYVLAYLLGA